ncbi:NACHT domain-containing protein [Nonomuraea sp. LPB2021202275-12-8]|uniref:NACHT domain-containing protein n=1 Tax=Nonomuraea sp. LPB2021202275-12-8 TaxID=3120159 RepID=UPI00300D8637
MRRQSRNWRRVVAFLLLVTAAGAVVAALLIKGLDYANQLSGVLGLTALGASVVTWAKRSRPHPPDPERLDRAAALLRSVVHVRCRAEAASRGLLDPRPLRVVWKATEREVSDHADVVGGALKGGSDDVPRLAQAFLRLPHRRLAIIGPPASGKSTLALLLTLELARDPAAGHQVPVLLPLASWPASRERPADWIARRITIDHPSITAAPDFTPDMAAHLLAAGRLLPVLDGLDELPSHLAGQALVRINQAIPSDSPLIISCRAEEYEAAVASADVLTAAFVVEAQPVRPHDAADYLRTVIPPGAATRRWQPVLTALERDTSSPLTRALSSPLAVSLARSVYRGQGDPSELLALTGQEAIERHLIASLVPAALADTSSALPYDGSQVMRWLRFLARSSTGDLAWWRLHRSARVQTLTASAVLALLALGAAATAMAGVARTATVVAGLATGVAVAFVSCLLAVLGGLSEESVLVRPAFQVAGRVGALGRRLVRGTWEGLLAGLIGGAAGVYVIRVIAGLDVSTVRIFAGGVAGGLLAGLARALVSWSLCPIPATTDTSPAESLRAARNRALVMGAGLGLAMGGLCALAIGLFLGALGVADAALFGVLLGSGFGAAIGVTALLTGPWFPYVLAHTLLAVRGRLPWRLTAFLDDLHELGILRRAGPAYQFRHARIHEFLRGEDTAAAGPVAARAASAP